MSGGERNRVHLAKVLREGHNFLLLGEVELVWVLWCSVLLLFLAGMYANLHPPPPSHCPPVHSPKGQNQGS